MRYILYTDGSCLGNPDGPGGYAAVLIQDNKEIQRTSGGNPSTTNNRMEITAVLEGLRMIPEGAEVLLKSDSEYVIKTIQGIYSPGKNADLWQQLGRRNQEAAHHLRMGADIMETLGANSETDRGSSSEFRTRIRRRK